MCGHKLPPPVLGEASPLAGRGYAVSTGDIIPLDQSAICWESKYLLLMKYPVG